MKTVRIFNPLHVLGNKISVSDTDELKILKIEEHPEIRPQIEVIKTEVMKYHALVDSIKSFEEMKDRKGKDTSTYLIGGSQTVIRKKNYGNGIITTNGSNQTVWG